MGFNYRICPDDPILTAIRKSTKAVPLKIPSERIRPLSLFLYNRKKNHVEDLRIELSDIFEDAGFSIKEYEENVKLINHVKSKYVNATFGINLVAGLAQGLDSLPSAEQNASINSAREIAVSFSDPKRVYVKRTDLSQIKEEYSNIKTGIFDSILEGGDQLFLVDMVYRSKSFSIHLNREKKVEAKVTIEPTGQIPIDTNGSYDRGGSMHDAIVLSGNTDLTFAFSCIPLYLDESNSRIIKLGRQTTNFREKGEQNENEQNWDEDFFGEHQAMLEWD